MVQILPVGCGGGRLEKHSESNRKKYPMKEKKESVITSAAALLVLFTAMLDPRVSAGLAVAMLLGLFIYTYLRSKKKK